MRILLTNDDGIYAPGLRAMRTELLKLGSVLGRRPGDRAERRGALGHAAQSASRQRGLRGRRQDLRGWAVEGRPADCVKLALLELLPDPPDVIVSGLNAGSNAGINVLYSGTVAAAIEGAFYRRTAIAVSLEYDKKIYDFPTAAQYARQVIEQILATRPAGGALQRQHPGSRTRADQGGEGAAAERLAVHGEVRSSRQSARPHLLLGQPRIPLPRSASRHAM